MAKRKDKKRDKNEGKDAATGSSTPLGKLRTFGDLALKQQTREITEFDSRLQTLASQMHEVMEREGGVGFAAPQIGLLSRLIVWRDLDDDNLRYTFVNPHILECSKETEVFEEGCLSVPGIRVEVERPCEVTVRYQSVDGELHEERLRDFPARVVQHEIDHLDGFLILDRCSKEERKRALKELREMSMEEY